MLFIRYMSARCSYSEHGKKRDMEEKNVQVFEPVCLSLVANMKQSKNDDCMFILICGSCEIAYKTERVQCIYLKRVRSYTR